MIGIAEGVVAVDIVDIVVKMVAVGNAVVEMVAVGNAVVETVAVGIAVVEIVAVGIAVVNIAVDTVAANSASGCPSVPRFQSASARTFLAALPAGFRSLYCNTYPTPRTK